MQGASGDDVEGNPPDQVRQVQVIERPGYKRVETDEEFRARVLPKTVREWRPYVSMLCGLALDEHAWEYYKMQRRIVERFS